jgi:hypothetical protein
MAGSTIFFNGRTISRPGSYSEIDASGLEQVGLGATGIVGVLGTSEGGTPVTAMTEPSEFMRITKPEQARTLFRSGDLREVADMLFAPGRDPDILGGAQQVVPMKVNPATQSAATLSNAYGDSIVFTSKDYGAFTSQINVSVATGTSQGKLLSISFEDTVESVDDLGGDVMFNLKYVKPTGGWDAITSEVESGGHVVTNATRAIAGLDGDITLQMAGNSLVTVASADVGDTTQQVVVYGLDASGAAQKETINLAGTATVPGLLTFSKVYGARVIGTVAGAITVADTVPATILTIAAGANTTKGLALGVAMYLSNSALTVVADGATTKILVVAGYSATGAAQLEKFTLTGATAVVGTGNFSEITFIALGDVEAARTLTFSAESSRANAAVQNTLQKVADYYNARYVASVGGFVCTLATGLTTLSPVNLDVTTGAGGAVSCLSPANPAYYADLWAMINWVTYNSQYVSAAKATGAIGGAPSNTTAPTFLSGGSEGTTLFANWQAGLNLLKKVRVNSIVVLSADPAVHAALEAHCAYMCGIGRSERDGFVGLQNTGMTDVPTKTEAKTQIIALNSRHVRAFAQACERYNTDGERQEFPSYFTAAVMAGMQAGSVVGTPLTNKYANVLALRQSSTWNPTDDAEEMIQAGLCFLENIDGVGRRVVRNVTTHLSTSNLSFTEGSVNEAVNFACYSFRGNMEQAVGKRGFAGTVNAAKGVAVGTLGLLKDEGIITASRSLDVELLVDVLEVSVEIAPVLPINFIKNTIHLVTIRQSAE